MDTVESWFRAVIADAKVIAENRVTFETLVPRDEVRPPTQGVSGQRSGVTSPPFPHVS